MEEIKPVNKRIEKVEKAKKKKTAVDAPKKGKSKKKKKDGKVRSKVKTDKDPKEIIDMNAMEDEDDDLLLWAREPELFEEKKEPECLEERKATRKKSKKKKENQAKQKKSPEIKGENEESPKSLEARKREVQEKANAKLKAREQEILKERLERERKVQLELDRIDQRSAKVKAMQDEIAIQEKFERNARAKMLERQKSTRLLQKMRQEEAQEKDLEKAKKAAIENAYKKAERIQQEALKKQKRFEEQLAAAAIQAKEQKEKSMRASEQAAKWSLEQGRKLQEIVNDKIRREQQVDEAAKSRKAAREMAKKNKIKNKEMERQQALVAAKATIDRRAEELLRDAMERQRQIQDQLEEEALVSDDEEESAAREIMEDMQLVAEESKKLDQIVRNKERWERESKRRLSCSTLASPGDEKQKETKALAIAKGNIERKKSELKRDAKKRQQRIRDQLEEVLALSDDEEDIVMDRELLDDIEKVKQEGKKLEEIVRSKERRERESRRRLFCTTPLSSLDGSDEDKALAAAKARIELKKLELQRDEKKRQQQIQDRLETESDDQGAVEILDRLLLEDMEQVAEESLILKQIVREKERWERQSMRRLELPSWDKDEESPCRCGQAEQ